MKQSNTSGFIRTSLSPVSRLKNNLSSAALSVALATGGAAYAEQNDIQGNTNG